MASLLSDYNHESITAVLSYLNAGERASENTLRTMGSIQFAPPSINHYLDTKGGFYDIATTLSPGSNNPVTLHIGTDVDFIGDGKVDTLMFGGQYHNLKLTDNLAISPFAFINTTRSPPIDFKGFSVGLDGRLRIMDDFSLVGRVQYNDDDIIESRIKGKGNGLYATAGIEFKF